MSNDKPADHASGNIGAGVGGRLDGVPARKAKRKPAHHPRYDHIKTAALEVAARALSIAELTRLPAARILDDIHIEAAEALMRHRHETPTQE